MLCDIGVLTMASYGSVKNVMQAEASTSPGMSCCSAFYEQDWVRWLAADNFHPGGEELSLRTVEAMALPATAHLLDVGCGTGTTAIKLAADRSGLQVTGVDASPLNVQSAQQRMASAVPVNERVHFVHGHALALPVADGVVDGVLCECTLSLFGDQPRALQEIRRVLKPGGRLGVTDMALAGELPADMWAVVAPWTCLSDAVDGEQYSRWFADAGFECTESADESAGLTQLLRQLKRQLLLLGAGQLLGGVPGGLPADLDVATIKYWMNRFEREVAAGTIRYLRFNLTRCD